MNRIAYIAVAACLLVMAGCEQKEDKIVSPVAQAPQTAEPAQQAARLDTAMKSSQESAAAVDQAKMASETGMKEAAATLSKQAETSMKTEAVAASTTVEKKAVETAVTTTAAVETKVAETTTTATAPAAKAVETVMAGGDAAKGAALAKKRCSMCHNFDSTKQKVGPGLKGVFGRAPSITGVPFAKWDAAALDKWLTKPKAVKSNTKMAFPGFPNKTDRDNVIAYLKSL